MDNLMRTTLIVIDRVHFWGAPSRLIYESLIVLSPFNSIYVVLLLFSSIVCHDDIPSLTRFRFYRTKRERFAAGE